MILRFWAALIIFVSSYSPLALIILLKDFTPSWHLQHPYAVAGIIVMALLSIILLMATVKSIKGGIPVRVTRVSNQSGELINYAIPYMITFFEFDLGDIRAVAAFGVFMALMLTLTLKTQNIFINPILACFGYGLYDAEYAEGGQVKQATMLSKVEFKTGQTCKIKKISRFMFLVTESDPTV